MRRKALVSASKAAMTRSPRLGAVLATAAVLVGGMAAQSEASLDTLKDKSRVLLVFAPAEQDPNFERQIEIARQHDTEMKERDLVVLTVVGAAHPDLRKRFKVSTGDFTVVLVGKDGGEKLRSHQPWSAEQLERTIDAMPMRRDEMRK